MMLDEVATAPPPPIVATDRLLWVGPLTIAISVTMVHVVRLIGLTLVRVPAGSPLAVSVGWVAPTADTVILCGLAVLVFAMIGGFADDPFRSFQRVALGALFVSFVPIAIMAPRGMNGSASIPLMLVAMHIAAYLPCVTLMPRLTTVDLQMEE